MNDPRAMIAGVFDRASAAYDAVGVDFFSLFGRLLVQDADLAAGEHVLDIGCGRGAVLFPAAERVGPSGFVTGIDLAAGMVERTRAEARERGIGNVKMLLMDAQEPALDAESYDVALSSLVVFFLPDPGAALRAWRTLLRPGGRLGLTTFAGDDKRWAWIDEIFDPFKPPQLRRIQESRDGPFSSTENLERLLQDSGFTDVRSTVREHDIRFSNADHWIAFSWSHGQRAFWEFVPEDQRPVVEASARERLENMTEDDGSLVLRQAVRYTIASRGSDSMKIAFSSNMPSFLEFKYVKALVDYERAHDVMLRMSQDHRAFNASDGDLEELRIVVDDLLTDLAAAWDGLLAQIFQRFTISDGGTKQRLADLARVSADAEKLVADAWDELFGILKEARNEYQHEGYWKNHFGVGQGNGPFMMDLIEPTQLGDVYILRDARRGLHRLHLINLQLQLGVPLHQPKDLCADCGGDEALGRVSTMGLGDSISMGEAITIKRSCAVCNSLLVAGANGIWNCPSGH